MSKDKRGKQFSCVNCGNAFTGYPPDDFHQYASIKDSEVEDPIKVTYDCKKCSNKIALYWGYQKMAFEAI